MEQPIKYLNSWSVPITNMISASLYKRKRDLSKNTQKCLNTYDSLYNVFETVFENWAKVILLSIMQDFISCLACSPKEKIYIV